MAEGLRRAAAAAKATRTGKCPVCGKQVKLRMQAMKARVPLHGPPGNRCAGSGAEAK
jgi:hypothetical protein